MRFAILAGPVARPGPLLCVRWNPSRGHAQHSATPRKILMRVPRTPCAIVDAPARSCPSIHPAPLRLIRLLNYVQVWMHLPNSLPASAAVESRAVAAVGGA